MTFDSLFDDDIQHTVKRRLGALQPESHAQWGRMSAHQAVCHLADTLRMVLGERPTAFTSTLFLRTVARLFALTLPILWPKGVETAPEIDQERGGTTPGAFQDDEDTLVALIDRFVGMSGRDMATHPIFGTLTRGEWGRWGYRHLDHHLTQFGV